MVFLIPSEIRTGTSPPGHPNIITDGTTTDAVSMISATLLGDGSDASYFEHWFTSADVYAGGGSAFVVLDAAPGYVLADLPLSVRAEMGDVGTTSEWSTRFLFDVYDNSTGSYLGWFSHVYGFGIELPSSGAAYSIDSIGFVPDASGGKTLADVNFSLQNNGLNLNLNPFVQNLETGVIRMLRVYELTFGVRRLTPPPLRRYPPVNNGGSGPTRHYPRTVNRRAGGTY